jgi:ubiquinol-cytochrome c reductase iron-sulfur subunit
VRSSPAASDPADPNRGAPPGAAAPPVNRRLELLIAAMFLVSGAAGVGLFVVYASGGQTQLEGILLSIALGGIGAGIVLWAQRLLPDDLTIEQRHPLGPAEGDSGTPADHAAPLPDAGISRRTLLVRALAVAFAGLAGALALPIFSLGPAPSQTRAQPWRAGLRLVGLDGKAVAAGDIPLDGIVTVFPEGSPGSADGQTVLIHADPALIKLPPERASWAPQGFLAYSKVCTHAGCPVGLYRSAEHRLICPCHQSTFEVLEGARPSFGPAARPLPQLPIRIEADGTFTALGGFPDPVGPSFWDMPADA